MTTSTARNASLADLAEILRDQQLRKLDVVAPASSLHMENGVLVLTGTEPVVDDDGVTLADGYYRPTAVFDEGVADKLQIPVQYLKRLREQRPDLYDANVNGWLHGARGWLADPDGVEHVGDTAEPDARSFMVRCFRGGDGSEGVARAFLSDRYRTVDNLDVLTAALEGVKAAGVVIDVAGCDLTDRRMYVRITAPEVQALAPKLLARYRSPFSGAMGADNPTVFAGLELSNSETGGGAFTLVPRLVVQVCKNGMKITKDAVREVHLGGQLDAGVVRWSESTQQRNLELVTAKTADAVATFLDVGYMETVIAGLEEKCEAPVSDAQATIQNIGSQLRFSQERIDGVLDHFIQGADLTAGGVLHAVTSYAQTVDDADQAAEIEASAFRAFDLAAR